ncbi:hypothetical protein [Halorubrum sp. AS12]|uniref:hypothetical protein n=1 Tax=Halorubrum sp. AS12 TaxID=3409687 RepID=UPI003DA72B78
MERMAMGEPKTVTETLVAGCTRQSHRAGSVYYPHYLTTVNLRTANLGQLRSTPEGIYKSIAKLFDLVSPETQVADVDLDTETNPDEIDEEQAATLLIEDDDVDSFERAKQKLRESGDINSQTLSHRIGELLALDTGASGSELDAAGDEVLQYTLANQELTTHSLEDLAKHAREREFPTKADRIAAYEDDLDRLGFSATRVIEDFPIQTFVYGYTRGSRENARIQSFSSSDSDADETPIFVDTAETEAVQFDLDPVEVLLWIACNFPDATEQDLVNGSVTLPAVDPDSKDSINRAREEIEELGTDRTVCLHP